MGSDARRARGGGRDEGGGVEEEGVEEEGVELEEGGVVVGEEEGGGGGRGGIVKLSRSPSGVRVQMYPNSFPFVMTSG